MTAPMEATLPAVEAGDARHFSDQGNAERLVARHGELVRYVEDWDAWLVWNTRQWERDPQRLRLIRMARDTCAQMIRDAASITDRELKRELILHALKTEDARRLREMIFSARDMVAIVAAELNRDEMLLNVANGTIDLRSGELLAHDPSHYLTRCLSTAYDPDAECPRWERFLAEILPDPDLRAWLQKALGYTLTGSTIEQCLFFMWGKGQNGKSTFINTIRALLEGYAEKANIETFMQPDRHQNGSGPTPDLADLVGARLVVPSEVEKGTRFNESRIKDMTGGDPVKCRRLHESPFEYTPQFKLWLYGNHKPLIKSSDYGIRRRMRLIPFTETIPAARRDSTLSAQLLRELPGILAWCVRGCLAWQREGLGMPETVSTATSNYLDDMDVLRPFLEACCYEDNKATVSRKRLWEAYQDFTRDVDEQFYETATAFSREIADRYDSRMGSGGIRYWVGIGLLIDRLPEDVPTTPTTQDVQEACQVTPEPDFARACADLPDACIVCGKLVDIYDPAGKPFCLDHASIATAGKEGYKATTTPPKPFLLRRTYQAQQHPAYQLGDLTDEQQHKWFCRTVDEPLPPLEVRRSAWYALGTGLAKHFDVLLEKTPVETGLAIIARTLPQSRDKVAYEYAPCPADVAELIRMHSTQHRMEAGYHQSGTRVDLVNLFDARVSHAKYLRHLPVLLPGDPLGQLEREKPTGLARNHIYVAGEISARPGWYLVNFSVPRDWKHIGLVPVPGEGFPRAPGKEYRAWLNWREAALLAKYGWPYEVEERILFASWGLPGSDPLRTFHDKMCASLERLEQLERTDAVKATRAGLRAIVLHTIGNFARRGAENPTRYATLEQVPVNAPEIERAPDGAYLTKSPTPLSPYHARFYKPEWAADIWAGTRAHTTERALCIPFEDLLAIDGDGVYCQTDATGCPQIGRPSPNRTEGLFVDHGKVGDYKHELSLDWQNAPRKLPAASAQLGWLRDLKKGVVK